MRLNRIICLAAVTAFSMVQAEETYSYLSLSSPSTLSSTQDDFHWQGVVASGRAIEIKGIKGNIRAEPTSGSKVEVVASKHSTRSNRDEVQIRVVEHKDGVTICAVYPRGDAGEPNQCLPGEGKSHTHNNDVRVDFTVRVPAGVRLIARTVDGDLEAALLDGNIEAYSINGNIRISTAGYAQAKSITGSISASLGNANWAGQIEFETITGEITLKLPRMSNTELHAESNTGIISTEFPLSIQGSVGQQSMNGTLGDGGRKLVLKTNTGAIKLLRAT